MLFEGFDIMSDSNSIKKPSSSSPLQPVYPKTLNHLSVSVPDLDHAMKWYREILGFTIVEGPIEFVIDDSLVGMALRDIHGPNLEKMRMVWLNSGNQVGFEIIEYVEPTAQRRQEICEY
ncbi:MAG: VOC family protein [Candidatus Nitrosocosmicus sp.]